MSTTNKEHRDVQAGDLRKGDVVTNLGVVDVVKGAGMFVILGVRGTMWSLATGTADVLTRDVVLHVTSDVTVERWVNA